MSFTILAQPNEELHQCIEKALKRSVIAGAPSPLKLRFNGIDLDIVPPKSGVDKESHINSIATDYHTRMHRSLALAMNE